MPRGERYVAFDLGAESGRVMLGTLDDGCLQLEQVHRFSNTPVRVLDSLHWNVLQLWHEMKQGLACIATRHGSHVDGIAVDTWAQDFGLLDQTGALLGLPYTYRDGRTAGILTALRRVVSEYDLYQMCGMSSFEMCTLPQLLAMRRQGSPALEAARSLLLMPGLFTYWLSGVQANEWSSAAMGLAFDLHTRDWNRVLLARLGLPPDLPAPAVPTATTLGRLLKSVSDEVGLADVPVIAAAGHDTAAAAAIVAGHTEGRDVTFISSGTWSVLGKETAQPIITQQALTGHFQNEMGAGGSILFAYNSMGLWLFQECRRHWLAANHDWSYADLTAMAEQSRPFAVVVNPDDAVFMPPGDMAARLADFCRRTGQEPPETPGSIVRAFLEGLALRYRKVIEDLQAISGRATDAVQIIGGGSRNGLLCQLTANATGRPVIAGPAEATATGNVLLQALARGTLSCVDEVKEVAARSCQVHQYDPRPSPGWDAAYETFLRNIGHVADQ